MIGRKLGLAASGLAVLAVAGGVAAWTLARPIAVTVAVPARDVAIEVYGLGTTEARTITDLAFEVGGTITDLTVDIGDRVPAGQVLARVDSREQEARLAKARADVQRAAAELEKAEASLARAAAVHAQRQQVDRRRQQLLKSATVSAEAAEDAAAETAIAAADISVARSGIGVARAALREAEAQQAIEVALIEHYRVVAPFETMVVSRFKERGSVVNPGEKLLTVADPRSWWVRVFVDEGQAGALAVGQPATIRLRSLPHRGFTGRVARIDPESDRVSEERRVYLRCLDCPPDQFLGEQAEAVIEVARLPEALLVPQTAIEQPLSGRGMVWTVEDGRLVRRTLSFGPTTLDGRMVAGGGLPEGARVVVEPRSGLRPGRGAVVAEAQP